MSYRFSHSGATARAWLVVMAVVALATPALADGPPPGQPMAPTTVINPDRVGSSLPLRDLPILERSKEATFPTEINPTNTMLPQKPADAPIPANAPDTVIQRQHSPLAMPAPLVSFEGVGANGYAPPDTTGDVGPNHYVQWVNVQLEIFDKTGTSLVGPIAGNQIWTGFGGPCETNNAGDPIVLYDHLADRWVISQFTDPYQDIQCIAASQTGDPTGAWYLYQYSPAPTYFPDYPKFGVWTDGIYYTANLFTPGGYQGGVLAVFDKAAMYTGAAAQMQNWIFTTGGFYSPIFSALPADIDGAPPAPGTPALFASIGDDVYHGINPVDNIFLHEIAVDWATPANSTYTQFETIDLTAAGYAFDSVLCGYSRNCIPLPSGQTVDPIAGRAMFKLQYRNFGSHETLVFSHTVDAGTDDAAPRWYELRNTGGGGWGLHQGGTFAPDSEHRWMGDVAMDVSGNMALGYSIASGTTEPGIAWTGRLAADPLDTMPQGEDVFMPGTRSGTGTARWGDYSTMSVDPLDDCTFWYTQEYNGGDFAWQTRIAAFKFPSCVSGSSGTLEGTVTSSSSGQPIEGAAVTWGGYGTLTAADGTYSFAVPVGTDTLMVEKFGFQTATLPGVAVAASDTVVNDFALNDASMAILDGYVTDDGHGWPLYARVDVAWGGMPVGTVFTDPFTGYYMMMLPETVSYDISVEVIYPGYDPQMRGVFLPPGGQGESFQFVPNASCSAPGYQAFGGLVEDFESGIFPPAGWTVTDEYGSGLVWDSIAGCGESGNFTGGAGEAACASSDIFGSACYDTFLISPVVDMSANPAPVLDFLANFQNYAGYDYFDVDVSTDGSSWTNVLSWNEDHGSHRSPPGEAVSLDLAAELGGSPTAQFRFRFNSDGNCGWYWYVQVDEVELGPAECAPQPGAMVAGFVTDANTTGPINGAMVESDLGAMSYAFGTPDDPAIGDGLYATFAYMPGLGPSTRTITASADGYAPASVEETLVPDAVNRMDFALDAGLLSAMPDPLEARIVGAGTDVKDFAVLNDGGVAANVELMVMPQHVAVDPPIYGPITQSAPLFEAGNQNAFASPGGSSPASAPHAAGDVIDSFGTGLAVAFGVAFDPIQNTVWIGDAGPNWGGSGYMYEYTPDGTATGRSYDFPWNDATYGPADFAFDPTTGYIWVMEVGGDNCIHELDPDTGWTGTEICAGWPTSMRGLAYDPMTDTFFAGNWFSQEIVHFDRAGNIITQMASPVAIDGLAFNANTGHLFAQEEVAGADNMYVLDPANGFNVIGTFTIAGQSEGKGLAFDCDGYLWAVDGNAGTVFKVDPGETVACPWLGVDWLELSDYSFAVPSGGQTDLDATFMSDQVQSTHYGLFKANIAVGSDTPYGAVGVPVYMTKAFFDVPHGHWADPYIHGLAGVQVTKGCGFGNYCPTDTLSRAQMAVFIVRLTHGPFYQPPAAIGIFDDVVVEDYGIFADYIEQLFNDGITSGCAPGMYCPDDPILRSEMAVFITKAKGWMAVDPPTGIFADVPTDHWAAGFIERIATEGVTSGCGDGTNYCPDGNVTRAEMAVFLVNGWNVETFVHPMP